jgi:phage terminase small subunit
LKFRESEMALRAVEKPTANQPAPPHDLAATGRELWGNLSREYRIDDESGKAILAVACRASDRAESCRVAVAKDGLVVRDRFRQTRPHPLLAVERAARAQMLQALKALSLPVPEE